MNYVGRIFVGLIAILSIMFAMMAIMIYATHRNWRNEIMRTTAEIRGSERLGYKPQLEDSYKERDRLQQEITLLNQQLAAEKGAKIQALAKAEAVIQTLSTDYQQASNQLTQTAAQLDTATKALQVTQTNLTHTTAEVDKLRLDIATAHNETDKQIKMATALTDKLTVASGQVEQLGERNQQLATDVAKAKTILTNMGRSLSDPLDAGTIRVAGQIRRVNGDKVELSIGTDDGVRIGQKLDIYRGDKYVGRLRVVESKPDQAVAAVEPEYQQFPIQKGDNVASRL